MIFEKNSTSDNSCDDRCFKDLILIKKKDFILFHCFFLFFSILCEGENFDDQFHFEYRGPVVMKGKSEPMDVYILSRD